jgi:hypothetical protein
MRHALLVIAMVLATAAHADRVPTLHLAVHGSVDAIVVGAAISKELGVRIVISDGTCELPCLDISVDGSNTATVVYAPRSGSPRQRAITIGSDTTQWPLMLTLIAGNVVRDEAQDVLAELPSRELPPPPEADDLGDVPPAPALEEPLPPPPPAVIAPAPPSSSPALPAPLAPVSPEPPRPHRWLGLGFVPGLSTDLTQIGSVRHFLSLNVLVGVSGGSSGLALSGIADVQRGLAAGFQVGGIATVARQVAGTQIAGIAAVAGDVDGVQVAGTAAVADRVDGFQIGGIAAASRSSADNQVGGIVAVARGRTAIQVGGIAAVAGGDSSVQVGGIASVARGSAGIQVGGIAAAAHGANFQVGGIATAARDTANIQVAGIVNVARRVRGLQLAPINVAREVDGVQFGVINVGGSRDGFSFGLINIVPGGRYDLEAALDSSRMGTVLFRHGGRRWHNVYGVGGHPIDETGLQDSSEDIWMYGLGFGPSLELDSTVIDLELVGWQINHGARHETDISLLGQLRLSIARHWGPFGIVAGGILNTYITNDPEAPLYLERREPGTMIETGDSVRVTTWPSAFIGIRI